MMYRAAKFVSAISAGVVVSVPVTTIPLMTVEAAEDCLAKPKDVTPPGQHWYYLIDRGSKRRCWYLHKETGTSSHASITRRARRAAMVASRKSEPAKSDLAKSDLTMTRTSVDARAELGAQQGRDDNDPQVSGASVLLPQVSQQTLVASDYPTGAVSDQPNTVSDASPQSPVTARWPEPAGLRSTPAEPPLPSFVVAAIAPDVKPTATTVDMGPKVSAFALTSADMPATATRPSFEPLVLATIGAITLTGFAGSSVYVVARSRRRPRSHASVSASLSPGAGWPPAELVDHSRLPQWLEPTRYPDRAHDAEASSSGR
jgi:hypothetical protein